MKEPKDICNEKTFNKLYETHGNGVWRFIYYKCGDGAQADDLVQEAFIKLWQNCSKITKQKAKSFLYTVCNNAFLNQVAHKKVVLKYAKKQTVKTNFQSPEFLMEEDEFRERLKNSIENLTEAQRTAFLLNRIEGKKYAEIAEMLNISVKAVEKRMSQALAVLRKEIGNV